MESELSDDSHHWNLICQQVMMAPLGISVPLLSRDFGFNKDQWDGYATERERLINHIEGNSLDNNVVLTVDIHTFWANEVSGILQDNTLVEFVVSSVTTANSDVVLNQMGDFLGAFLGTSSEEAIKFFNPHIEYSNLSGHGYIILNIDSTRVQSDFYQVGIQDLNYSRSHLTSWEV
ncbi:MAG: alkaline phosphatase D [Maribacter sp.]